MKKNIAKIVAKFDDPVGNWCKCNGCNGLFFIPYMIVIMLFVQ